MDKTTEESLRTHAAAEYPRESCGLIILAGGKEHYVPCRNIAERSGRRHKFMMSPEDYADAEDVGKIIALVHSHPDHPAIPSQADRVICEKSGLVWHVVRVDGAECIPTTAEIETIAPCGYQAPLVGREFFHGVLDCYALVQDWFERERGVLLPDFERRDGWWSDGSGENLYMQQFRSAGFIEVSLDDIQVGDCFIMQHRSEVANHSGVYLGGGLFLHHLYGRLSTRDVYGGYWKEITRVVVRYQGSN